jgi:hypothetical protein
MQIEGTGALGVMASIPPAPGCRIRDRHPEPSPLSAPRVGIYQGYYVKIPRVKELVDREDGDVRASTVGET